MARLNVAIVVGHTKLKQGARVRGGPSEYEFNSKLAQAFKRILSPEFFGDIFFRDGLTIQQTYANVKKWGADCAIEFHFNACEDWSVAGTETLCGPSNRIFARSVHEKLVEALHRKGKENRGIKVLSEGDRGWASVTADAGCPVILLEPFFGSNENDYRLFVDCQTQYLYALKIALIQWGQNLSLL